MVDKINNSSFSEWIYDELKGNWRGMLPGIVNAKTWKPPSDLHCTAAGLVIQHRCHDINNYMAAGDRPGEEAGAACHHNAHHVPVELLLCEPEGQRAPPATGHRSNTMWIYWAGGETHQSTATGFYSGLETRRGAGGAGPTKQVYKSLNDLKQNLGLRLKRDLLLLSWHPC